MSNAFLDNTYRTSGTKQYKTIISRWYQEAQITSGLVFRLNGSSYFTSQITAINSGTYTVLNSNKFLATGRTYDPLNHSNFTTPMVSISDQYIRLSAPTVANGGIQFNGNYDLSNVSWIVAPIRSITASVGAKITIRRTTGNEVVCAFTTSAVANTPEIKSFPFKNPSAFGVTHTGTPALNSFTDITQFEITVNTIGQTLDIPEFYLVNNIGEIIGTVRTEVHDCIEEATVEATIEDVMAYCKQRLVDTSTSKQDIVFKLTTNSKDFEYKGVSLGSAVTNQRFSVLEVINSANLGAKIITANKIVIPLNLSLAYVKVDGKNYYSVDNSSSIPANCYYYNPANGDLVFNTIENGKIPEVSINNSRLIPTTTLGGMKSAPTVHLQVYSIDTTGKEEILEIPRAKLKFDGEATADFDTQSFSYTALSTEGDILARNGRLV